MENKNYKPRYQNIGFTKNIIICMYDLLLLFSILFFFTLPLMVFSNGEGIGQNIFYKSNIFVIFIFHSYKSMLKGITSTISPFFIFSVSDDSLI